MLRKFLLFLIGILAVAIVVALVTGGEDDGEETTGATTAGGATVGNSEEAECQEKGISTPPRNEGTCVDGGTRYVAVNRDGVLKLPTLEAEMLGIRGTKKITGESGGSAETEGIYAIVELSVTNRTDVPEKFEDSQIVLWVGGPYSPDAEVQGKVEGRSFLAQGIPIQPGDSQIGTVVFDLTSAGFKALDTKGNLDIVNFGSKGDVLAQDEIGTIRTYQ